MLGASVGTTNMHSFAQLLGGRAANLAALQLAMPAPGLPRSVQQQDAAADARLGQTAAAAAAGADDLQTSSLPSLTPGISNECEETLAESFCFRGEPCAGWCCAVLFCSCSCVLLSSCCKGMWRCVAGLRA